LICDYASVSADAQDLTEDRPYGRQLAQLKGKPRCERVFCEKIGSAMAAWPQITKLMVIVGPGDAVIIPRPSIASSRSFRLAAPQTRRERTPVLPKSSLVSSFELAPLLDPTELEREDSP
jgi:hypothetical protein